jgi:hypothetical protein
MGRRRMAAHGNVGTTTHDLAAAVTSTGLDPEGHGEYWQSYGFGELPETARVRRDALARLLPRLAIADPA